MCPKLGAPSDFCVFWGRFWRRIPTPELFWKVNVLNLVGLTFGCSCFKTVPPRSGRTFSWAMLEVEKVWSELVMAIWNNIETGPDALNIFLLDFTWLSRISILLDVGGGQKWNLHYPMSTEVNNVSMTVYPPFPPPWWNILALKGFEATFL